MLKISGSTKSTTRPGKSVVEVGGDDKARYDRSKLDESGIGDNEVDDESDNKVGKKSQNLFKSKKTELGFLKPGARIVFTKLR